MNIINKQRGKGKTTQLIYTSATTGYQIVCQNQNMAEYILNMANDMDCNIKKPMTVAELRRSSYNGYVLVDEVTTFLSQALNEYLGASVIACTMSIDCDSETLVR